MKNKKLLSLKNKIFLCYTGLCFVLVVLIKNTDYIYWDMLDPKLNPGVTDFNADTPSRTVYFILNIVIFVLFALIFYRLTAKAIKQESERRLQEQNLMYAAIAHDLKTPMTSVQGFAKALSDGKIKPEEQQEIFDIIYRKSNSMNDMVNTLFDYAKLGTDGYKPEFTEVDICALVRDIVAENYCDFEDHGIELDIDIPETAITINADKTEMKRAVTNLIVNIYKHNPDGIRALTAVISGRRPCHAIIGMCRDKNISEVLRTLIPYVDSFVAVDGFSDRAENAQELAELINSLGGCARAARESLAQEIAELERRSTDGLALICGSLYLVSAVHEIIDE